MQENIIREIRDDYSPEKNTERILRGYSEAINKLAHDLYAKETHFIFELIQNAEDNTYEKEIPTLRFVLTKKDPIKYSQGKAALIVENNEVGFQKENVAAICDVGQSTKTKKQGYIGEKGIGFKSVFRVTSCPHIFSNGFQFSLPEKDEFSGLGYIVPRWLQSIPRGLNKQITSIYLPLDRSDFPDDKVSLALKDIAPETIIFLKRLKTIELVVDLGKKYEMIIEKDDSEFPLVKLTYLKKDDKNEEILEHLFWVTSKEYKKPADVNHEEREEINTREVSIAIPLVNKQQGKLFAYLPVWENTGLPFLINADFLLTSSREGVKENEPWNGWLRDCIADVYVESLVSCLSSNILPYDKKIKAYASIPRSTNRPFLEPVIPEILEKLKQTACVYIVHHDCLAIPKTSSIARKDFWDLFGDDLPNALRKTVQLVKPELRPYDKKLRTIGVSSLSNEELIECLEDEHWLGSKSNEWFLQLYSYLKKNKIEGQALLSKKIVKIWSDAYQTSMLSCNDDQPIYFERDDEARTVIKDVPGWLEKKIPVAFLERSFLETIARMQDSNKVMAWMMEHLNVHPFSKTNFCIGIQNVLLDKYEDMNPEQIASATSFLVAHADEEFKDWDKIPVVLDNGEKYILSDLYRQNVVVPENYDLQTGWQHIWVTEDDRKHFVVLSNYYEAVTVDHLMSHAKFYSIKYIIKKFPDPFHYQNHEYYNEYDDYKAPEWTINIRGQIESVKRDALFDWAKHNTVSSFGYIHRSRPDGRYNFSIKEQRKSEFEKCLLSLVWLPTQKGFMRPPQVFLPRKEIKEIFGDTVPYLQGTISEQTIELLGIKSVISTSELVETLKDYSNEVHVNQEMLSRIYSALDGRTRFSDPEEIASQFKQHKIIFVLKETGEGDWFTLEQVIWEDAGKILGDDFVYLEKHYPRLKDFFVTTLGVKEKADPESFAQRWLLLQQNTANSSQKLRDLLDSIYRVLLPIAKKKTDERPEWWSHFIEKALVFTQNGSFVEPVEVIVPDDGELKKIFSGTSVEFVWRPEKDSFSQWAPFYEAFGISRISESVTRELAEEADCEISKSNEFITPSMIQMLSAWLREKENNHYRRLVDDGFFETLRELQEAQTEEKIEVIFTLEASGIYKEVEKNYPVFWDRSENLMIINRSTNLADIKRKISSVIAKGAMSNRAYKDLAHWVELILEAKDTDRTQDEGWPIPKEISKLFVKSAADIKGKKSETKNKHDKQAVDISGSPKEEKVSSKADETSGLEGHPSINQLDNDMLTKRGIVKGTVDNPEKNEENSSCTSSSNVQDEIAENAESNNQEIDFAGDTVPAENIIEKIEQAFCRDGETSLSEEFEDDDDYYKSGDVKNPDHRREKTRGHHKNRIADEPTPDKRRQDTIRRMLEPADPGTRTYLADLYSGKCQICGKTFPQRNGKPFFIVSHIVDRKHARLLDNSANALCLCPLHFSQWRHGAVEADNILEQIFTKKTKAEGGGGNLSLQITLCGKKCEISYKEKHLLDLQSLLNELENMNE
ncbi:MAG: hypothetical protein KJ804_04655 [Proteobacteria bacterium]|nr:hypothetical protein [Pseudomonadota bacterium]